MWRYVLVEGNIPPQQGLDSGKSSEIELNLTTVLVAVSA